MPFSRTALSAAPAAVVLFATAGCTTRTPENPGPESGCTPGKARACTCADGATGAQSCRDDRTWPPCRCTDAARHDAGTDSTVSQDGRDADEETSDTGADDAIVDTDGTIADTEDDDSDDLVTPSAPVHVDGEGGISPRIDYSTMEQHFVAPDGSDDAAGTRGDPWSVDAAESRAEPGDVVNFLAGDYDVTLKPPSGNADAPVVFRSHRRHEAAINSWRVLRMNDGQKHVHIQGFRMHGTQVIRLEPGTKHVTIRDNYVTGSGESTEIVLRGTRQVRFLDNVVTEGGRHNMMIITPDKGDGGFANPDGPRAENILLAGNSFSRAGHQPAGSFANRDIVFRGNVFHNMIGRNAGLNGDVGAVFEENLVASAAWGPKSASPAAKFTVQNGIFRFNELYRNHGRPVITSPYSAFNVPAGPLRVYNNTFARQDDTVGYMLWDRPGHPEVGSDAYIAADIENNVFDASTSGQAQLVPRNVGHSAGDVDVAHNLFDGNPAIDDNNSSFTLDEARGEFPELFSQNTTGSAEFADPNSGDFSLGEGSDARNAGSPLTRTTESGTGTTVPVEDADYFHDGLGIRGLAADIVKIGDQIARIEDVDWENDELTLDAEQLSWEADEPVGVPWSGGNPDAGAFQSGEHHARINVRAPERAEVGETVEFEADVAGEVETVEICWQFGNGEGACGASVSHTYDEPLDYGIRVRVVDAHNDVHWGTHYTFVSNESTRTYSESYRQSECEKYVGDC